MQLILFYDSFHRFLGNLLFQKYPMIFIKNNISSASEAESASVFADTVKFTKEYSFTRTWHYIDVPIDYCNQTTEKIQAYLETQNNTGILKGLFNGTNQFKFALHFLQDLVQPFHSIGYFKGGNKIYGMVDDKNQSLHALWDNTLPLIFKKNCKNKKSLENTKTPKNIYKSVLKQIEKSFKRACHFRLENNFNISSIDYYKKNKLNNMFYDILNEYIQLSKNYFQNFFWEK